MWLNLSSSSMELDAGTMIGLPIMFWVDIIWLMFFWLTSIGLI